MATTELILQATKRAVLLHWSDISFLPLPLCVLCCSCRWCR